MLNRRACRLYQVVALFATINAAPLFAQPVATIAALAQSERPKLLNTLKALVIGSLTIDC